MKTILGIEFPLSIDGITRESFDSQRSLLDWDIVLFRVSAESLIYPSGSYFNGKPCLDDINSFAVRETCEHWKREVRQASDLGKTIIFFLSPKEEFYVATGQKEYSGAGRNQQTTRIVDKYTNYRAIPVDLNFTVSNGTLMKPTQKGMEILGDFWKKLGMYFEYETILPRDVKEPLLVTKNGDIPVGAIFRSNTSAGSILLMPDFNFSSNELWEDNDEGDSKLSAKGMQITNQIVGLIVELDKSLKHSSDVTPEPKWAKNSEYILTAEAALRSRLLETERKAEEIQRKKEEIQEEIKSTTRLRGLLYEKGKALEHAILDALKILGFSVETYRDSESEFDVVFECPEGRLLGEAEGKDNKPINVDKLRQLSMNIHEDLLRDEVALPAKGVLFGNGYRTTPPSERSAQFTDKCISASKASLTALLSTSELYNAVQYLQTQYDNEYARLCRTTIIEGVGIICMPAPPRPDSAPTETVES